VLDADGIAWNVLLPLCDGDVSTLEGVRPFDRMLAKLEEPAQLPKSSYLVWGANHNGYNTEWQESDSFGCIGQTALFGATGPSTRQQETALRSMAAFFRSEVGRSRKTELATLFNPDAPLPAVVRQVTRIERGYSDTPDRHVSLRLEEFDQPTGRSSAGQLNEAAGIGIEHRGLPDHAPAQRVAAISWSRRAAVSPSAYFQTNWASPGAGRDLRGYRTLELRLSEQCRGADYCDEPSPLDPTGDLDFSLALVKRDGSLSPSVPLKRYASLQRPAGIDYFLRPILQTVRIPLSDFGSSALAAARGLRLTFDRSSSGAIHVGNIRVSTRGAATAGTAPLVVAGTAQERGAVAADTVAAAETSRIVAVRTVAPSGRRVVAEAAAARVEIEVESTRRFPVSDALPELRVGGERFRLSRFTGQSSGGRLAFTLPAAAFAALPEGATASVVIGAQRPWSLGRLRKAMRQ
jgi:hypothetical protein